ncbi:glycosyl hydrolases family 18-domain-containing protein [Cladorrhinum sp. PSN259]|nr:glycosyl hydrolases family 18-domain-containing protein [Cladorrhinum sp. PSN259]
MDSQTEEGIFKLTTEAKQYNSQLQVFISVGGWTFSDNGTVTQPLLGDISSTEANRQKFADNVVKFCNKWGFDGLDLDWEYPGAPDRGGKPQDTDNFTKLMKTLRQTFNSSPRRLGLSFTIPSSYWYLKWFDMPGLLKYADWTNLMSYDLHGTWDRNNPIGAIVQGHTNLTEIKLAAELLWRVGVKPEQVALGYGFYGRSFELSDPSCSTPGCAFKGGAREGPCSKTSGILMHYEIQAILKQVPNLKPVWDKKAAVKYLVFDKNQWISYDDADTFGQKIEWANSVGFGGALIWAADTDDDKFSAMSGLLGKKVSHVDTSTPALEANGINIAQTHNALAGKDCTLWKKSSCRSQRDLDNDHVRCPDGKAPIGWDKAGCGSGGKPICCSGDFYPQNCQWRGSASECNGQCHPGEQKVHGSSWGGGFKAEDDTTKCTRGGKAFCCEAGDWKNLISGCSWTKCGGTCPINKKSMLTARGGCFTAKPTKHYCCNTDTLLHDCRWRGSMTDCPVANCEKDEVFVALDSQGESLRSCAWARHVAGCCKVSDPPPPLLTCERTTCDINPLLCIDSLDEYGVPETVTKRGLKVLEERGGPREFFWTTLGNYERRGLSRTYDRAVDYMANLNRRLDGLSPNHYVMEGRWCDRRRLERVRIETGTAEPPEDAEVEHAIPAMMLSRFPAVASHGRQWARGRVMHARTNPVPSGPRTRTPAIPESFWRDVWENPQGLPRELQVADSFRTRRPDQAFAEGLGSSTNRANFLLLQREVNRAKGEIEIFKRHMSDDRLRRRINGAIGGNQTAAEEVLQSLQETQAVFTYLNDPDVITRADNTAALIQTALRNIEAAIPQARGLAAHWDEFYPHYFSDVSAYQRQVVTNQTMAIRAAFQASTSPFRDSVLRAVEDIENKIPDMKYPFE